MMHGMIITPEDAGFATNLDTISDVLDHERGLAVVVGVETRDFIIPTGQVQRIARMGADRWAFQFGRKGVRGSWVETVVKENIVAVRFEFQERDAVRDVTSEPDSFFTGKRR